MNYEFISRYSDYKLSVASLYHTIMRKSLACLYLNIFCNCKFISPNSEYIKNEIVRCELYFSFSGLYGLPRETLSK